MAPDLLTIARTDLVLRHPFFGVLALWLDLEVSAAVPTAATDGRRILWHPSFLAQCSAAERIGVLAHEVLHCAMGHLWRRGSREPRRWNVACDYAVNPIVLGAGLSLPRGVLHNPAYGDRSAEWIYDRLPPRLSLAVGEIPGAGGVDQLEGEGPADAAEGESSWAVRLTQAANAARAQGVLPQAAARWATQVTTPKVDWRAALRVYLQPTERTDYAWTPPNRRGLARGWCLPSLRCEQMPPLAVVVDTSGSIDGPMLDRFGAELRAIVEETQPTATHVLYADAAVHRIENFGPDDPVVLRPIGGGGTDFRPALTAVDALDDACAAVIYLTDLQGTWPAAAPGVPVIWAVPAPLPERRPPYGDIVMITDE